MSDIIIEKLVNTEIFNLENRNDLVDSLAIDLTRDPAQDHWDIKDSIKKENKPCNEGLLTALLRKELDKINPKDKRTNAQHLVEKVVEHASKGNAQFMSFVFDRIDGKQTEKKELSIVRPLIVFDAEYSVNNIKNADIKELKTTDTNIENTK